MPYTTSTLQAPSNQGSTKYPFTDKATLISRNGTAISQEVFLDARVYAPGAGANQYIKTISYTSGALKVYISDSTRIVATGTYSGTGATITLKDDYGRDVGMLYGNPDLLTGLAPESGVLEFTPDALPFVATVLIPQAQPVVRGFLTIDDQLVSGDVWLIGEDGVVLTVDGNEIAVNIVGDHFFIRRLCAAEVPAFAPARPLRKLLVQYGESSVGELLPNTYGNVFVRPGRDAADDNIVRIHPIEFGLRLELLGNFA